jgi:hypothetical protein
MKRKLLEPSNSNERKDYVWLLVSKVKVGLVRIRIPVHTEHSLMLTPTIVRQCPKLNGNGAPGAIRTPGPQIRSLMLYPAELRVHWSAAIRDVTTYVQYLICHADHSKRVGEKGRQREAAWHFSASPSLQLIYI